jgi:hypothetical protein
VDVYHVTGRCRMDSIEKNGLRVAFSQGQEPALWFVTYSKLEWACGHVKKRHGWSDMELVVLGVNVRPYKLVRTTRGVYKCLVDIPWVRVKSVSI